VLQFQKSMTIHAPVQQVFDYVANWSNLATIWPSLIEVKDLTRPPSGGGTFKYVYKMAGLHLEGKGEDTEYVAKERIVTRMTGDLEGTIIFRFEPAGATTKVQFAFEYTAPAALLRKVGEPFVTKLNEHEAALVLQNLQTYFEVAAIAPPIR
jgi:uncharacterized membrane protein